MLQKARSFFLDLGVMEVDCPALSQAAPIDVHIDVMQVAVGSDQTGYLHTSPEYGMKRLLSAGIGDIYQISHVFRREETGPLHNPEFTMAEWYRIGFSFEEMIEETLQFIRLFLGPLPHQTMSYRQMLQHYLKLDYLEASPSQLIACANANSLDPGAGSADWDKDTLLQLLVSLAVEPELGEKELFVLNSFPASQAALSKTVLLPCGERVARRFEIYYKGIELANGYHELTDAAEQRRRLESANSARQRGGKAPLKMDGRFLEALENGIPDCCGVAVGFDRLMMLRHGLQDLKNVLPFLWEES
jgi:lysyl-tRNA synthetase class 2